jgi:hypothetical protein
LQGKKLARTLLVPMALNMVTLPCAAQTVPARLETLEAAPLPEFTRSISTDGQWRGADGAYSIGITDDTAVWLFGDSFISFGKHPDLAFVNDSVATRVHRAQTEEPGHWRFYFRQNKRGQPDALFKPKLPKQWYWPGDGFLLEGKLYLFMKRLESKESSDPMWAFDWIGDDLLVVDNPLSDPRSWTFKRVALPDGKDSLLMGVACHFDGNFLYSYSSCPSRAKSMAPHPVIVARIAKENLQRGKFESWQYYCTDAQGSKSWLDHLANPVILFDDAAAEMTVTKVRGIDGIVCTYMPPLSSRIMLRRAERPEGPWSEPLPVYDCPEAHEKVLGHDVSVYSAKAHPEMAEDDGELIITYCPNPGELKHYKARPDLYIPRAVRIKVR